VSSLEQSPYNKLNFDEEHQVYTDTCDDWTLAARTLAAGSKTERGTDFDYIKYCDAYTDC
jgi:hypothetical protein